MSDETANTADTETQLDDRDRTDMVRLAASHATALNDLMERHAGKLFNYLIRCLQNEEDAADAAQETFVRVYQNRAKFDTSHRFSTWLYTIATNLVKDRYRYRTRHPKVSLDAEIDATGIEFKESLLESGPDPGASLEADERADAVRRAIAMLPEELRHPLILFEYEELSHAEVGAILKCSAKAVETRLYRARQHLRQHLSRWLEQT